MAVVATDCPCSPQYKVVLICGNTGNHDSKNRENDDAESNNFLL